MSFAAIPFPAIDPILIQVGPFAIRWYALAYVVGLMLGWRYMRRLTATAVHPIEPEAVDDFLVWATMGVVLGGRIGYVLFYNFDYYLTNPASILQVWQGGMSFHGGFLGVVVAAWLFCRKRGIPVAVFSDLVAASAPIGLLLGRIANFINGELFGRVTDVPWGVVFPHGGPEPRHPSQLYEAALEGALLFVILALLWRQEGVRRRPWTITGVFLIGYGTARAVVELFRQPDIQVGYLAMGTTMGQWLSAPMIAVGIFLILWARSKKLEAS